VFAQTVHAVAATVGFTSWFLLWCSLVLGLAVRNGWAATRVRHSTLNAMHGTFALLGLTLGVVHGAAQLAAPGGTVRLVDVVLPFVNPRDPVGVGVGVLSLELLLAAAVSVPIRKRLGHARWRAVHTLTYAAFLLLTAHVLISGSDVGPAWLWGAVLTAGVAVVALWVGCSSFVQRARGRLVTRAVDRGRALTLAVDVDAGRCQRFGFCEHEAPEIFRLEGNGRLTYRAHVPADAADRVISAIEVCPARAIALRRPATTVQTADTGPLPHITPAAGIRAPALSATSTESALRTGGLPIFPVDRGGDAPRRGRSPAVEPVRTHRRGRGR
jgi:sulfoxide reductase heme-binding subunit YedZ